MMMCKKHLCLPPMYSRGYVKMKAVFKKKCENIKAVFLSRSVYSRSFAEPVSVT